MFIMYSEKLQNMPKKYALKTSNKLYKTIRRHMGIKFLDFLHTPLKKYQISCETWIQKYKKLVIKSCILKF